MDNSSEQDEQMMALVTATLKLTPEERDSYLRSACGTNLPLYEEAAEALRWEERMGDFLQVPLTSAFESPLSFAPGQVLANRFEIVRKIGEGGMGVVCEAFDRKRNQRIAIKFAKPGFGRMLSPELEGALKVRHRNVCLVNEVHSAQTAHGDVDFLAMELLEGETLAAALSQRGTFPISEAREIARQLCAGLKEAHRSGVIHRDLKAANVILCRDTDSKVRAVITDFGLSGEAGQAGFFGTPRYMAPELLLGQKATNAADIYALGIILYELVLGLNSENTSGRDRTFASRSYQRLIAEFLSIEPERRYRAFATAQKTLSRYDLSRRQVLVAACTAATVAAGSSWFERERIKDWLEPLPKKRFVALLAWPPNGDQREKSIVNGAIDAMENELVRAEAADHDLFITYVADVAAASRQLGWLGKLADSLGVNLALQASAFQDSDKFGLLLNLVDVATGNVLRRHRVLCLPQEIATLPLRAVQSATSLLNVRSSDLHWASQELARLKPTTDSPEALKSFQLARQLWKEPNDDGLHSSIDAYKKAIDLDPQYAAAYAGLAAAYLRLDSISADAGVLELARANAEKVIQLDQNNSDGHLALAMVMSAKGNFEAAQTEMRLAHRLDPTNPTYLSRQADIYMKFRKWDQAEQTYRQLHRERPNYWAAYNDHGVLLASAGRYQEAVSKFGVAVAASPVSTLALTNLGQLYFRLGQLTKAESSFRRSLSIKQDALAYASLGVLLRVEGKFSEALACCKKGVELDPSDDEGWLDLADCYAAMGNHEREAFGAYRKAADQVRQLLNVDPTDNAALMRLALCSSKIHETRDPSSLIRKSEELGPLDVDSEFLKIRVLEISGKREAALAAAASCLRRGPVRFQIENERDLRSLTRDPRYAQLLKSFSASLKAI